MPPVDPYSWAHNAKEMVDGWPIMRAAVEQNATDIAKIKEERAVAKASHTSRWGTVSFIWTAIIGPLLFIVVKVAFKKFWGIDI